MGNPQQISLSLTVEITFLENTGRRGAPVSSGYRPICKFRHRDGTEVLVGMCQLELIGIDQLERGRSAPALLRFGPGLDELSARWRSSARTSR